jgi:hypothetical protein
MFSIGLFFVSCAHNANVVFDIFSQERYNALYPPLVASKKLHENNFDMFRQDMKNLATKHGVNDFFKLALAHRHTDVQPGEVLCEYFKNNNDRGELITLKTPLNQKIYPASWIFDKKGNIYCFEYSTDISIKKSLSSLHNNNNFFEKSIELIKSYNITDVIGLSLNSSSDNRMFSLKDSEILLELSHESYGESNVFASVIKPRIADESHGHIVQTSWCLHSCDNHDDEWCGVCGCGSHCGSHCTAHG